MQRADDPHNTAWAPLIPVACAAIVAINLAAAVLQKRMNGYSLAGGIAAATIAWTPFGLDLVGAFKRWPESTRWLLFFPIPVLIGVGYLVWHPAGTDFAPFILVFMNGELVARSAGRPFVAVIPGVGAMAMMIGAEAIGPWLDGAFIWVIGITFGWIGGFLIRQLDRRTQELEEAQTELAAKAAAEERSRIAREVHDVIAHSLSVTMLHVTAARMALDREGRLDEARDWLREAEEQGRKSLTEIRRTVGLLGPDESANAPPMPTATDLPTLVQDFRSAGLEATMSIKGDLTRVPEAAGLNLYRIVQESLTNVAKHAPGATARVDLEIGDDNVFLSVHNTNGNGRVRIPTDGGGRGVRGIMERAVLLGGEMAIDDSDGWTVVVTAPLQR